MVRVFSFRIFLTEECFEMVHYAEPGKKAQVGLFPVSYTHLDVYKRQLQTAYVRKPCNRFCGRYLYEL